MQNNAIGIFDSGVGGLSITREIQLLLPKESLFYLSDSINAPYGKRQAEEILQLSIKNTEWLLEKKCKIIVVACNTATTNAIAYLRAHYNVPIIGIEPAIKPAALHSKTGVIGVLATKGTLSSSLFQNTSSIHTKGINVIEREGNGIVPLIEANKIHTKEMRALLSSYIVPMLDQGMDQLVLGCTHYPFLKPVLEDIMPASVTIIDSGLAVAKQTKTVLVEQKLLATNIIGDDNFYTNANLSLLKSFMEVSQCNGVAHFLDF